MPKPPNLESNRIVIQGRIEEENIRIKAFKEICNRNGLTYRKEILDLINVFLRKHNWPPGNSQVLMTKFVDKRLIEKRKCDHPGCDRDAVYLDFPKPPGESKVYSCKFHHDKALENQLLKNYKLL